MQLKKWEYNN